MAEPTDDDPGDPDDPDEPDDSPAEAESEETAGDATPRLRNRKRRTVPRPKRIAVKKLTKRVLDAAWVELGGRDGAERERSALPARPKTWGECRPFAHACPYVGCRHHNFLDVNPETGTITMNHPHLEPWELEHPCSLLVTEGGSRTLEDVGEILNLTRERIRQVEIVAQLRTKRFAMRFGIEGKIG